MTRRRPSGLPVAVLLALLPSLLLLLGLRPAQAANGTAGGFGWPLAGVPEVGRRFAPPTSAWGAGHRGVDLLATEGAPVLAAAAGLVTYAGLLAGRGVVTVTHAGGLRTTYEPVDPAVVVGDRVAQGDVLGLLGTGHASCPLDRACLHWGLLHGSAYRDPLRTVLRGPVRLLPSRAPAGTAALRTAAVAAPSTVAPSPTTTSIAVARRGADERVPGRGTRDLVAAALVLTGVGVVVAGPLRR